MPNPFALISGLSAGGQLLGGLLGSDSADEASRLQEEALRRGINALGAGYDTANQYGWLGDRLYQRAQRTDDRFRRQQDRRTRRQDDILARTYDDNRQLGEQDRAAYDRGTRDTIGAGRLAGRKLERALRPGGDLAEDFDFRADPSYRFRRREGLRALDRLASARGNLLSGGAMRESARYASDLASTEFDNAYRRHADEQNRRFGYLSGTARLGSAATAGRPRSRWGNAPVNPNPLVRPNSALFAGRAANFQRMGSNALGHGSNVANLLAQLGNAQAAGQVGGANALASGFGGAANSLSDFMIMEELLGDR